MSHQPTLFDALGGDAAIAAAVGEFYRRVLADAQLAPFFAAVPLPRLKPLQAAFLAQALRGAPRYTGCSMREAHAGLAITDAHFDRVAQHLAQTLADLGVAAALIEQALGGIAPLRREIVAASAMPSLVQNQATASVMVRRGNGLQP